MTKPSVRKPQIGVQFELSHYQQLCQLAAVRGWTLSATLRRLALVGLAHADELDALLAAGGEAALVNGIVADPVARRTRRDGRTFAPLGGGANAGADE